MAREGILKQIETYLKKYLKNEKHILEAFNVIAFVKKQKNIDNITQYITATSLLILSYILAFFISSIFNCILAINMTTSPFSIFNFIILTINIFIYSLIISPINFGYILMIFNDFYKNLQSDLGNLFFFLSNSSKKISFFISTFIINFITFFTFLISIFILGILFSIVNIRFINIVFYLIIFVLFINLLAFNIVMLFVFIKKVEPFINSLIEYEKIQYQYIENINKEEIIKKFELKDINSVLQDSFLTALNIFFKNYFKLIFTVLFAISGIILLGFGVIFTLAMGIPAIAVLIRKYL
ncbi:MAG: hypothetical protein N2485_05355 [bacterium]|nr:hypothetical protein [bacterium]